MNDRLPPGQRLISEDQFPILDLGSRPEFIHDSYRFTLEGLIEKPLELTWDEVLKLPKTELTADFHCVTRWSKFDVKWGGIAWKDVVELAKPSAEAAYIVQYGLDGYSTNVPLAEIAKDPAVLLAYELYGKPLPREHGAPLRMIIPHLYGWKGSKFLHLIEFAAQDHPGFWEVRGYHNRGDVMLEERYS